MQEALLFVICPYHNSIGGPSATLFFFNKKRIKMKLAQLSLIVTDDCNFNCTYCFQEKGKQYMTKETIKKTIDFFYPFLAEDTYIIFYGGEPMLAFEQIKYAVSHFREKNKDINKKLTYSVTTNGSLVDEEALEYFNRHGFSLMLSYDGFTQDTARQPGSSVLARELIEGMNQYPGITFSINSVFSLATLPHFSHSLREIVRLGGRDVTYNLSILEPWSDAALSLLESELQKLGSFLLHHYKETGDMPVSAFRSALPPKPAPPFATGRPSPATQRRMFACTAAKDRMAVSPEEKLWGCFLFYDNLKNKGDSEDCQIGIKLAVLQ